MVPLTADIRQHTGDLLVSQEARGGHIVTVADALHFDRSAQAVHDDLHDTLGVAGHPFGTDQRGRKAVEALPRRLVARGAEAHKGLLAGIKERLLLVREETHGGDADARLTGPDDGVAEPTEHLGHGGVLALAELG